MKRQITIETDDAGVRLNEEVNTGLAFYATHFDDLIRWDRMLDEAISLSITHNIDYGVNFENLKQLISLNSVLTRGIADLTLISCELYLSKIKLQQAFYIKHAYLIVYETFENLRTQQSFLKQMASEDEDEFIEDFNKWVTVKKEFFRTHKLETSIRVVRDKLAGHIELDFKLWYEMVLLLDAENTATIIIDYMAILKPLLALTTKMLHFYKNIMDVAATRLNETNIKLLNELEALIEKVNESQSEKIKLDIDIQLLRDLL